MYFTFHCYFVVFNLSATARSDFVNAVVSMHIRKSTHNHAVCNTIRAPVNQIQGFTDNNKVLI